MELLNYTAEYPVKVNGERVWRTYWGGRELDKIHGIENPEDGHFPEEWMCAVIRAVNAGREDIEEGLCYLADRKTSLKQLIEANPAEMLGAEHVAEYGTSTGVLIKLIDSKYRLSVQVHPDKAAAMRLFGSRFGKTECWHIFSTRDDGEEEPCLYIGFKKGVTPEAWEECFERQDYDGMLSMLNKVTPSAGETYIIRGGVPHAIGSGCFLVEIQEPTDLTIRLERVNPCGEALEDMACHQGLGFKRMFECFKYDCVTEEEMLSESLVPRRTLRKEEGGCVESLIGYDTTECFKMDKITVTREISIEPEKIFSCMYVKSGEGAIICGEQEIKIAQNDQLFIPAASAGFSINNTGAAELELFRFYGPKM